VDIFSARSDLYMRRILYDEQIVFVPFWAHWIAVDAYGWVLVFGGRMPGTKPSERGEIWDYQGKAVRVAKAQDFGDWKKTLTGIEK